MTPSPQCHDKRALKAQVDDTRIVYVAAIRILEASIGPEFDGVYEAAEVARKQYEAARNALAAHESGHGC